MKLSVSNISPFLALAVALYASDAHADFVARLSVATSSNQNGSYDYIYRISNETASTLNVESFSLTVSPEANLQMLSGPTGWQILYAPGDTDVLWSSGPDRNIVILPGSSGMFSFNSGLAPTLQSYDIFGIDFEGENFDDIIGQIASPGTTVVPEPTSMIPLGTGLLALAGYTWHRRRSR